MALEVKQPLSTSIAPQTRINRPRVRIGDLVTYAALLVLALFFLFPLAWMMLSSFKPGQQIASAPLYFDVSTFSLQNYEDMLANVPLWVGFKNTFIN